MVGFRETGEPRPSSFERTLGGNRAFHNFYNDYSHISDPNLRRRLALSEIDKVPFGWYHVRAVLVAGVGFFLDSYDIFAINLVTTLLGVVFWSGDEKQDGFGGNGGQLPGPVNEALKAATTAGIVVGMLLFGRLADTYGRRTMYGVELGIILVGTFSCALISSSPSISATGLLIFWRVVMGIGIGGDYPLSSVITSEFAPTRWRGAMTSAVFSMQGLGQLTAAIVALITTVAFKKTFIRFSSAADCDTECRMAADQAWRIIVGVGGVPAILALYYRITIPETPRYTFDIKHDVDKADADIRAYVRSKSTSDVHITRQPRFERTTGSALDIPQASWHDLFQFLGQWRYLKRLIGASVSWFCLDFAYYGLALNSPMVLTAIGYGGGDTLYHKLYHQAVGLIILACAGALPGYLTAVFTIDTIGRKPLQITGFLLLTAIFAILGFGFDKMNQASMLALYIIAQFCFNAGPNTTTFLVPGECFPTRYRATAHGISAAIGKLGAIVAQVVSVPLLRSQGPEGCTGEECTTSEDRLLQIFALSMFIGTLISLLLPETKGITLEELSGEPRTSYNAGRNGSVGVASALPVTWNPFAGGQPAGFSYPRSSTRNFKGHPQTRVGIMTTPTGGTSCPLKLGSSKILSKVCKGRASDDSADIALRNQSVPNAEEEILQDQGPEQQQQQLPLWGAGWGRIDRGGPPPMADNPQLQDVGSLLRPNS